MRHPFTLLKSTDISFSQLRFQNTMTEFHLSGMKKNIVLKTSAQASAQFLRRITSVLNRKLNEPIQLILILWLKVRQTRIFAIVRVFPYYEEAKKLTFFLKWRQLWSWKEFYSWVWPKQSGFFDLRGVFTAGGIFYVTYVNCNA